ncbi:MAG: GntR family transcriptional regulator [Anaerolineae bacterium]|nr:GntR family transcriptional regulator [Anaerolineae bacterium]
MDKRIMEGESSVKSSLGREQYRSLTDIAYDVVIAGIINQEFKPGAVISIDNLARQLNMSNTPVREALMRAHGQRLVNQRSNHGFVVTNILTPEELHDLFEVRYALEMLALNTADWSAAADVVAVLDGLYEQMKATANGTVYHTFGDYMVLDRQFHRALIELSGNKFLVAAWEDLHVHLHLSRLYTGIGLFDRSDSTNEHGVIVEAVRNGDKKAVISLLGQHIKRVDKRMHSFLTK